MTPPDTSGARAVGGLTPPVIGGLVHLQARFRRQLEVSCLWTSWTVLSRALWTVLSMEVWTFVSWRGCGGVPVSFVSGCWSWLGGAVGMWVVGGLLGVVFRRRGVEVVVGLVSWCGFGDGAQGFAQGVEDFDGGVGEWDGQRLACVFDSVRTRVEAARRWHEELTLCWTRPQDLRTVHTTVDTNVDTTVDTTVHTTPDTSVSTPSKTQPSTPPRTQASTRPSPPPETSLSTPPRTQASTPSKTKASTPPKT